MSGKIEKKQNKSEDGSSADSRLVPALPKFMIYTSGFSSSSKEAGELDKLPSRSVNKESNSTSPSSFWFSCTKSDFSCSGNTLKLNFWFLNFHRKSRKFLQSF